MWKYGRVTLPRSLARGAAILSAVGSAATAVIVAPTATAVPCPDIEVVFARGTAEPAGVGRVGQAFTDALTAQVGGRTVGSYAVNYPASYDFLTTADGATDATNHVAQMALSLPVDQDRPRRLLAGRGGDGHAGRSATARQQDRRGRLGATIVANGGGDRGGRGGIRKSRNEVRQPTILGGSVRG